MVELEIPERALQAACDVYDAELTRDIDNDERPVRECAEKRAVRAAAPVIVAAELVELADAIDARALKAKPGAAVPLAQEAHRLRRRAAELDPGNTA